MKKQLRLIMLTLLCAVAGTMWGQEKTYDFTDKSWSASNGTLSSTNTDDVFTGSGSKWEINDQGYFIFGKSGATLKFPVFDFGVEKIVVVGNKNASASVKMNVYVGSNAVSTETTGCGDNSGPFTLTYEISEGGQAAGNQYTLKVTSAHNAQITQIFVYKKEGGSTITVAAPTFSPAAGAVKAKTPITITAAEGCTLSYTVNGVAQTSASNTAEVSVTVPTTIKAKAVKNGVESDEVTATYTISVAAPTFSPAAGAVEEGTVVTITSPDAVPMRFTVDDGEPSTITTGTIERTVNQATTLKAVAIDAYGNESEEVVASYTIVPQGVQTATIDFEDAASTYTDWTFTNMESKKTNDKVTAHGGSYFGDTGGKASAYIETKELTNPISITFYVTKQSSNTTKSTWKIQTSTNGSNWTDVKEVSATDMAQGTWKEVTADLSSYKNVYVRIYYSGSTAIRNIDDVQLVYRPLKTVPELSWSETTIEMNIGETREIPDFICPEGVARTNMMSSNNDVVTFDAVQNPDNTYTILLVAQAVGTATITGYTDETSEYEAGEASFTVTVVDPTHVEVTATYLFEQNTTPVNDYGSGVTVTSGANDYIGDPTKKTWTSGAVTLETDGKYRWKTNSSGNPPTDLRFHNQDKEDKPQSYMKFSVPSGSLITKIVMTGFDYNLWAVDCGNYSSGTWTGNSQEVTFAWPEGKTSGNIQVQTVTVTYTTPSTEEPVIWMSYSSANDLDFTGKTDYTAYIATNYRAEEGVVVLTKIEKVPSGEGILIKSNDSSKAIKDIFKESDVATDEPITTQITQMLVGAPAGVEYLLPEEGDKTNFVLAKREGVVGFYKVAQQGALAPNKAYLQIPTASLTVTSGANGITFVEDGTTAIQSVTTATTTDDAWYTLQGVRVAQPTRGLYIHNGKKVVVK